MEGKTKYIIMVSEKETVVFRELLSILDRCPIDLSNDDYLSIIRAISAKDPDVDIDGIELSFNDYEV